jgi:bifunctional non-homologous end joining protein LigD
LLHDGDWTEVGKVTIPASEEIPAVGALIDVEYLYAYKGGALFQTIFRGVRTDYLEADCTTDKLCYKPDDEYVPGMEAVEDDQPSL